MAKGSTILTLIGVGLVSIVALCAAPNAKGAAPEFHCTIAPSSKCAIRGATNDLTFGFQGANSKCTEYEGIKGAQFNAKVSETSTSATLTASIRHCSWFGGSFSWNMNSCDFMLNLVAGSNPATATVDVKCDLKEDAITFTVWGCEVAIVPQTGLTHVTFANVGSEPTHIAAQWTLEGIKYTMKDLGCPNIGTFTDAKLTGTTTFEGFEGPKVGLHVF